MYSILNQNHVVIARDFKSIKEAKTFATLHGWQNILYKKQ